MQYRRAALVLVSPILLLLASCAATPSVAPTSTVHPTDTATAVTPILDPCAPAVVGEMVRPINDVMLQFDDYATLAQYSDRDRLAQIIPNMQTMRRLAESRTVPACMEDLQRLQVAYMNATLFTLVEFQKSEPSAGAVATGIVEAQYLHQAYTLELARLLGVTLTPPTTTPALTATP